MPGTLVFDELPEELQQRLAERNPELRAYRAELAEGSEEELQRAYASLARAQADRRLAVAKAKPPTSTVAKLIGLAGTVFIIITAHGRI